ncbi:MAG TPA: MASE1 domain-containing protein [Actinomycetota bacterium]|nr:MASE1 domain-containing protein [Actinomycetota bacterium]
MEARSIALPERPVDRPALRTLAVALARTALLAGVYVAAGKAAFALAFVHTSIAPVWPPSGIALAAVLLWGRRAVPGVLLGAFLFNASRRCRCGSAPSGVVNCS